MRDCIKHLKVNWKSIKSSGKLEEKTKLNVSQCETNFFSEFRSYRKTKFSAPEFPELNGTNTVVPNSENFRENYRNCYRKSGPKPLSEIIPEPKPLSENNRNFRLLRKFRSKLDQYGQIHTCQKWPQKRPSSLRGRDNRLFVQNTKSRLSRLLG